MRGLIFRIGLICGETQYVGNVMEQPRRGWSWVKKGSAIKPNGKYQVSSDIDTDLVDGS